MPKVKFVVEYLDVEAASGKSVREVALQNEINPNREMLRGLNCGGRGLCGTCRVWVKESAAGATSEAGLREKIHGCGGGRRLACQCHILGDIEVTTMPGGDDRMDRKRKITMSPSAIALAEKSAQKPAEAKPVEPVKPAEAKPAEAKPAEAKPAEAKPVEPVKTAEAKPTEVKASVEAKPTVTAENASVEAKPTAVTAENVPVEAAPTEVKAENAPVEATPTEVKAEIASVEAKPTEAAENASVEAKPIEVKAPPADANT